MTLLQRLAPILVTITDALLSCISPPSQSAPAVAANWRLEPARPSSSLITTKAGRPVSFALIMRQSN